MTSDAALDLYDTLELRGDEPPEAIQRAVRDQRRIWNRRAAHADPAVRREAEDRVAAIAEAERVLLDEQLRARYDTGRFASPAAPADPGPSPAADHVAQAREALAAGDPQAALRAARVATQLAGGDPAAWAVRSAASAALGRHAAAAYELAEASRLAPDLAEYHFQLADSFAARRRWTSAADAYRAGGRIEPHNPRYWRGLATAHLGLDEPDNAVELLEQVLRGRAPEPADRDLLARALHAQLTRELSELRTGQPAITSQAQVEAARHLSARAAELGTSDPDLAAAFADFGRAADAAEERVPWVGDSPHLRNGLLGLAAVLVLAGLLARSAPLLVLAVALGIALAVAAMRTVPRWRRDARRLPVVRRGV